MGFERQLFLTSLMLTVCLNCHADEKWLNYKFTSHKNKTINTKAMLGKYIIVNFTYTDCVMYCTTQTQQLKNLRSRLVNEVKNKNIQFISISLLPDRDSPKSLNSFAKRFSLEDKQDWQFVTADPAQIAKLKNSLGVQVAFGNGPNQINHSTKVYLFDTHGELVETFDGIPIEDEKIIKKINALEENII